MVFNMIIVALLALFAIPIYSKPEPDASFRTLQTTTNIESVIMSIDERLRIIDNMYSMRFARLELTAESQTRKLETLESKISRIETLLELRIDKLTEGLSSKNLKEELAKEQMTRKVDTVYERLNHRMSYMESRIENNIVKLQGTLDQTLNRISQQLEQNEKTNNEIENDIIEISSNVEEAKSMLVNFNSSISNNQQSDSSIKNVSDEVIKKVEKNIVNQFNNLATKLSDMYNEMSEKVKGNENMLRNSLDLVNTTKKELQEDLRSLKSYRKHSCQTIPDDTLDYLIDKVDTMTRKNDGNYQRLDNSIERLHERQELYQESCHRLQLNEPQIENRIAEILTKMLDTIENSTINTNKNYETILERLKSHHTHVSRSVGYTTNSVNKLSEQLSSDFKTLYKDITINNPTGEKIDNIILSLQEIQEQFLELNFTLTHTNTLSSPTAQNQQILNTTATILTLIQILNENINGIIDRINDYPFSGDAEEAGDIKAKPSDPASKRILNIFNMTEDDFLKTMITPPKESTISFKKIMDDYDKVKKVVKDQDLDLLD